MSAGKRGGPGSRIAMFTVFMTILVDFIGFSVLIPVLPLWAQQDLGGSPIEAGGLPVALYGLAQLLFLPAWGWASDRFGRRPVILVSLFGTALSFVLLTQATSLAGLYAARVLGGFFAASIGTAQAVVTDLTPPSQRARGMGLIGAAFGLGFVLGNALGGLLADLYLRLPELHAMAPAVVNERLPFLVVAALAFGNWVLASIWLPETRPPPPERPPAAELLPLLVPTPVRLALAGHDRRIRRYLYLFFHLFGAFAALESMCALFLHERFGRGPSDAGLFFSYIGVFIAVTQGLFVGRLANRFGEPALVAAGLLATGLGLIAMAQAPSYGWLFLIGPVIAIGNGLAFPTFTSLFSQACSDRQAGELLGQSQSMATTGRIAGPIWAGWAMGALSPGAPFTLAGILMLGGLVLFLLWRPSLLGHTGPEGPVGGNAG